MPENTLDLLRAEMDRQLITDNTLRAGIAAIIGGESEFKPQSERSYKNTDNGRIRAIFRSALADKAEAYDRLRKRASELGYASVNDALDALFAAEDDR